MMTVDPDAQLAAAGDMEAFENEEGKPDRKS